MSAVAENIQTEMPEPIVFTDSAAAKVADLIAKLPTEKQKPAEELLKSVSEQSKQKALGSMAVFPAIMLVAYIALFLYFRSRGGYKPVHLDGSSHA